MYRFRLFIWILSGVIEPIVWSVLWFAVSSETKAMSLNGAQVLTYYALIALVGRITQSWTYDDLRKEIYEGRYSKYLLWPSSMVLYRLGLDLGNKVMNIVTMLPLWFLWVAVLSSYDLWDIGNAGLISVGMSVLLAVMVKFSLDIVLAHCALWVERAEGIGTLYNYVLRVCGGMIVPLALLPGWAGGLFSILPFRYVYSFPVEIVMGTVEGSDVTWGFAIGGMWCLLMLGAVSVLLRKGLPLYEAVGI